MIVRPAVKTNDYLSGALTFDIDNANDHANTLGHTPRCRAWSGDHSADSVLATNVQHPAIRERDGEARGLDEHGLHRDTLDVKEKIIAWTYRAGGDQGDRSSQRIGNRCGAANRRWYDH